MVHFHRARFSAHTVSGRLSKDAELMEVTHVHTQRCARPGGREPEWMGWCYAHAEGSGATSQDRGKVAGRRGSHNDSTLAS